MSLSLVLEEVHVSECSEMSIILFNKCYDAMLSSFTSCRGGFDW